jgi:hypothetical protein
MPNEIYRKRLINEIHHALREISDAGLINHHELRGVIREKIISKIIRPLLPPEYEIGTGKIISSKGEQSGQTDIVIHSMSVLPPIMHSSETGLFPIEACYYSIEVKSRLNATELKDSIQKARQLRSMHSTWPMARNFSPVIRVLIALDTDLTQDGMCELGRYSKHDAESSFFPAIQVLCVVGRGTWMHEQNPPHWRIYDATKEHDEIIDFLASLINTLLKFPPHTRQTTIGSYIRAERGFHFSVPPGVHIPDGILPGGTQRDPR